MIVSDDTPSDDEMLQLLRQALSALPDDGRPPDESTPQAVVDGGKWVHQWLTMEAELAELAFDSQQNPELAGVRSAGSLRELKFVSGAFTVELEIQPGQRSVAVSGTIDPIVGGAMQLLIGGEVFTARLDSTGAFLLEGVAHGTVLAFVELADRKLRLGSFEI